MAKQIESPALEVAGSNSNRGVGKLRPWYRFYATTWLAIAIIGAALVDAQVESRFGPMFGMSMRNYIVHSHGWPTNCLSRVICETSAFPSSSAPIKTEVQWNWDLAGVVQNAFVSILLIAATALGFERWRRTTPSVWQISLRSLFGMTTVAAQFITVWVNEIQIVAWIESFSGRRVQVFPVVDFGTCPWYLAVAVDFAICCVLMSLGWIACPAMRVFYGRIAER